MTQSDQTATKRLRHTVGADVLYPALTWLADAADLLSIGAAAARLERMGGEDHRQAAAVLRELLEERKHGTF